MKQRMYVDSVLISESPEFTEILPEVSEYYEWRSNAIQQALEISKDWTNRTTPREAWRGSRGVEWTMTQRLTRGGSVRITGYNIQMGIHDRPDFRTVEIKTEEAQMQPIELRWSDGRSSEEATENDLTIAVKRAMEPWISGTVMVSWQPPAETWCEVEDEPWTEAITGWLEAGGEATLYFEPEDQAQRYGYYTCTIRRPPPRSLAQEELKEFSNDPR